MRVAEVINYILPIFVLSENSCREVEMPNCSVAVPKYKRKVGHVDLDLRPVDRPPVFSDIQSIAVIEREFLNWP